MEVPPRCQLNILSWKDAKLSKLLLNCYKPLNHFKISKFGPISFGLWGWAGFLSVDWLIACSDSENGSTSRSIKSPYSSPSSLLTTSSSVCASRVYPDWESCVFVISVPVPWVCLLCQHARWARSVPACQQMSPDVLKALMLSHCARWQFKFHKTVLMVQFICL